MANAPVPSSHHHPCPATIALPPRASAESFFASGFPGFSPGTMTLVSSLFAADDPRSFSQLLAGAMASPAAPADYEDSKYKQKRPLNLEVSPPPLFMVLPGFSPSGLLNSPGIFSPLQSPFGMSHQQALAQVTALAQSSMQNQAGTGSYKPPSTLEPEIPSIAPSEVFHAGPKSHPPTAASDKPVDDGYNWRKYGQKQVKGSEYPRSYYKCTCLCCPVKKKVERSPEGQIIEIIYKGQHNHEQSPPKKSAKEGNDPIEDVRSQAMPDDNQLDKAEVPKRPMEAPPEQIVHEKDEKFLQETSVDSRPLSTDETRGNADSENGPMLKKRNSGSAAGEPNLPQKTVVEPKIVVQTRSEVDLLDDGFRWRKYGQKVVKGNSHPRYTGATTNAQPQAAMSESTSRGLQQIPNLLSQHMKVNTIMICRKAEATAANISGGPPQPKSRMVAAEKHTSPNEIEYVNNGQTAAAVPQLQEQVNA